MPKKKKALKDIVDEDIIEVIKDVGGDIRAAAQVLDVTHDALSHRIYRSKQLKALFLQLIEVENSEQLEPSEVEQMVRQASLPTARDTSEIDDMMRNLQTQNLDILTDGLGRSGIKPATIEKLKQFGAIEKSAASFLVASLDLMHRMVVYQGVSLMEQAEYIKETYLEGSMPLTMKERQNWQRLYNQLIDQMGKSYDRVLTGTSAMVKLTSPKDKGSGKNKKAGFTPLSDLKKAKEDAK